MDKNKKNGKKGLVVGAMALMVALVGAMGATTYAKYASNFEVPGNTATVAKWGFVLKSDVAKLFGEEYGNAANGVASVVGTDEGVNVVARSASVAPGTTGFMTFYLDGTAEVPASLDFDVNVTKEIKYVDGSTTYSPIKWTMTKKVGDAEATNVWEGTKTTSELHEFNFDAEAIDAGVSVANTVYTLTWTWAFEGNDAYDTLLAQNAANAAAQTENMSYTLEFSVSANVVQVQN